MIRIVRTLAAALALAAAAFTVAVPAQAADVTRSIAEVSGRVVNLGLNKSLVIDLDEDVRDVLVSSPGVADAVVRSSRRVFLIGVSPGEANVFLFGDGGRQIAEFELVVSRDVVGLQEMLDLSIEGSSITARTIGDSMVLTGTAPSADAAAMAADLAAKFMGGKDKIVNMLTVAGSDQVHLKVVVAEVERETLKDLGIDTNTLLDQTAVAITLSAGNGTSSALDAAFLGSLSSVVKLMEERRAIRLLAEPTLTAVSGEKAQFLAGGEFPVPVPDGENGITIEYKRFGVQLAFRPVVLTGGRISLQIATEVSELSDAGSVLIGGVRVPSLVIRRAESTVELPSGGSVVMAGLIRESVLQSISGMPGLMDLPVLGNLFKSREFQRKQTELAIFVSPYLVDPVPTGALQRPDQNLGPATDSRALFLNHVNKMYSQGGRADGRYQGNVGFAFE